MKTFSLLMGVVVLLLGQAQLCRAQLPPPPPPPDVPQQVPGEPPPFDPNQTTEASPMGPLRIVTPDAKFDRTLTLVQAIEAAWAQEPDILQAQGTLRQREGQTVQERAALFPNVSFETIYSHVTVNSAGGGNVVIGGQVVTGGSGRSSTTDRLTHRLGVDQLLFDFGRTRNLILQADLLQQSAAAALLSTKNDVALNVKERFYDTILQTRLIDVAEDDLANRQQQLALARALYDAGEMAAGDVVRAQSEVTNSVVRLNAARLNGENARQQLLVSLGLPPTTLLEIAEFREPELSNKDIEYLLQTASEKRPDLLAAQKTVEARKAGLGAAYALNKPELSTFTGITYQGPLDGRQFPTLTAQLNLAFDIYDGGARAGAVTAAEGSLQVSEAQLKRTRLEVQSVVSRSLAQLLTAEANVEAARAGVESAREGVRIAEGRYRTGIGSLTDVLDSQRAFVQAKTNLVNSLTDLDLARARTRHALASPLEEGFGTIAEPAQDEETTR